MEELLNLAALRMNGYDYLNADPAPTEDLMVYQRSGPATSHSLDLLLSVESPSTRP